MKRVLNALRYGDRETRKSIGSVLLFAVLGIGMLIVSGVTGQFFLLVLGLLSGGASLTISQSFELVDEDFVAEVDKKGTKETVPSVSVKKDGIVFKNSEAFKQQAAEEKDEAIKTAQRLLRKVKEEEKKEEQLQTKKGKKSQKKNHKKTEDKRKGEAEREQEESAQQKKKETKQDKELNKKAEDTEQKAIEKQSATQSENDRIQEASQAYERYNSQVLKQIKRKYHVKNDHRPILIDNSKSYHIKECPAFIWRAHNKVYLLLLEKEPRRISISRELIKHVGYVPHVRGDKETEYKAFEKENMITSVFREYLPYYFHYKSERGNYRAKNLYFIYPDIQITSRSIVPVMDLLYLNFMPSDRITRSNELNGFFKRIYAAHILYTDKAYSITEYKNEVVQVLSEMCDAEMPQREFNNTLENLVKGRFISQEYADHYYRLRSRLREMQSEK